MAPRFIATLLLISILISATSAVLQSTNNLQPLLNSAQTDMQCRVAFETGFMGAMVSTFSVMSSLLGPRIGEMQSDKIQLSQYASKGDVMNYSIYLHEKFSMHLKQNADSIKAGFESLKNNTSAPSGGTGGTGGGSAPDGGTGAGGGGTGTGGSGTGGGAGGAGGEPTDPNAELKASMESLASTYKSLRDAQDSCFNTKEHALLVLNYHNATLNSYQLRAQNLTDRGIGAGNLLTLIESARSQAVAPLQNGVKSASNSSQLRILLNQYCLDGGCANGTNFHMSAKFETMRLSGLLAVMSQKASEAGFGNNVTAVQSSLSAARNKIDSWGTKDVTPDQLKAAWADIRSAAKGGHDLFIALNGSAGAD